MSQRATDLGGFFEKTISAKKNGHEIRYVECKKYVRMFAHDSCERI
jgi:hypothetical protein